MASARVVTDGAADLPQAIAEGLGIHVAHGPIHFGEEAWDGPVEDFWRRVRSDGPAPSTAPPTLDDLAAAFVDELPVCAVHVSAELSRTESLAKQAAAGQEERVHVVDSRSLSVGTGLVAMVLAQAADLDVEYDAIKRLARELVNEVHVYAVIEDVGYLLRGGRAGLVDAKAKSDARQVIAVRGHAIPIRQVKDRRAAIRELLHHVSDHARHGIERWAVGHGDAADVDDFTAQVAKTVKSDPAFVVTLGPAVGTHAGPDALVVGFVERVPV
jgi:DegV family protein with EDD domain